MPYPTNKKSFWRRIRASAIRIAVLCAVVALAVSYPWSRELPSGLGAALLAWLPSFLLSYCGLFIFVFALSNTSRKDTANGSIRGFKLMLSYVVGVILALACFSYSSSIAKGEQIWQGVPPLFVAGFFFALSAMYIVWLCYALKRANEAAYRPTWEKDAG